MTDEPADQQAHEDRHAMVARAINPTPCGRFLQALLKSAQRPVFVCCVSSPWLSKAVHIRSFAFAIEVEGGKVAWPEDGRTMPASCHAYLFGDDTGTLPAGAIAGAGGFSIIPRTSGKERARFEWVWLAPSVRRKGILSRQWGWLKDRNGDFDFDPVTEAMQSFAKKMDGRS